MSNRGFTLIECMVVLAIMLIISAFAYTSEKNSVQNAREKVFFQHFFRMLELARFESLNRDASISVCASKDGQHCEGSWTDGQIIFVDEEKTGKVISASLILFRNHQAISKGIMHWRSFPHNYLFVNFAGTYSTNGTFWYCRSSQQNAIWAMLINAHGRAREFYAEDNQPLYDDKHKILSC